MIALVLILAGCGAKQAPVDEPSDPAPVEAAATDEAPAPDTVPAADPAPAPPATEGDPEPIDPGVLIRTWTGAPCGERTYERILEIRKDQTWAAQDLVSPCPEGATCVWSGIVTSKGSWTVDGNGFALTEDGTSGQPAKARPTRLTPTTEGADGEEAGTTCPYR